MDGAETDEAGAHAGNAAGPAHLAMVCDEIGYGYQVRMAREVRAATGVRPFVVEAEDLLTDVRDTVERFCRYAGIPFLESSLSWQP